MLLYKKKTVPVFRYFFAIIVLTVGLTLTVVDVYGIQLPFGQQAADSYDEYIENKVEISEDATENIDIINIKGDYRNEHNPTNDNIPTSIPEPGTIILLASGLGLLRMARKKKS